MQNIKYFIIFVVLGVVALGNASPSLVRRAEPSSEMLNVIKDHYVITFKSIPSPAQMKMHKEHILATIGAVSTSSNSTQGVRVSNTFRTSVSMYLPNAIGVEKIKSLPFVAGVFADQIASLALTQTPVVQWGLDRIDQRNLPLDNKFTYPATAGTGVKIYILDTGIRTTHTDFGGRATFGTNTVGGPNADCHGHGTHVASSAGGTTYGVAKSASLIAVKVLDCGGFGPFSAIIAGVDFVVAQHLASSNKKSVINMSLIGGSFPPLNIAVANARSQGILVAVASGNFNDNACLYSPAQEPTVLTVSASDISDVRAGFSNFGTCVDLFAPGVNILGAGIASDSAIVTLSGTSMATPHVAGLAGVYWGEKPLATVTEIQNKIISTATTGKIINPVGSPNLLAFLESAPPCKLLNVIRSDGISQYCQLETPANYDTQANLCSQIPGGSLGDFPLPMDSYQVSLKITDNNYVRSWSGVTYYPAVCLQLAPGSGAIVPAPSCGGALKAICSIPV